MSDRSHVSMEQRVCLVCAKPFDTGSILLDRRLRPSMQPRTITGWDLCPEHRKLHREGYVALVECDPEKSGHPAGGETVSPSQVYRTGRLAHLKRDVFADLFRGTAADAPCVFVGPEVIEMLQKLQAPSD